MPVSRAARAAARCTRSSWALTHGLSVPISPMIPGRTPVPATPSRTPRPSRRQLIDGAPVDQGLGRVVRARDTSRTHHDLHARAAGQAPQPLRVAADARRGEVHQRPAAAPPEFAQLVGDEVLVGGELPVVPSASDVPEIDAGVLVRKGEAELARAGFGPLTVMTRGAIACLRSSIGRRSACGPPEPGLGWTGQVCHRAAAAERVARCGPVVVARRATVCSPPAPRQRPLDGGIQPLSETAVTRTIRCRIAS